MMLLHPMSVHFPIAIIFLAGGMYLFHQFRPSDEGAKFSFWLHGIGLLSLLVAVLSGRYAQSQLEVAPELISLLERHELMAYLSLWWIGLLLLWRYLRPKMKSTEAYLFLFLFLLGIAAMSFGASLGGEMVYQHGVGVMPN
jgi:uncharacterized membrane protein